MHFDFADLRLFINISEAPSITQAARKSFLSTAAASNRIKKNLKSKSAFVCCIATLKVLSLLLRGRPSSNMHGLFYVKRSIYKTNCWSSVISKSGTSVFLPIPLRSLIFFTGNFGGIDGTASTADHRFTGAGQP